MKVVQAFAQEPTRSRATSTSSTSVPRRRTRAPSRADAALYSIVEAVGSIAIAGLLWHGGSRHRRGDADLRRRRRVHRIPGQVLRADPRPVDQVHGHAAGDGRRRARLHAARHEGARRAVPSRCGRGPGRGRPRPLPAPRGEGRGEGPLIDLARRDLRLRRRSPVLSRRDAVDPDRRDRGDRRRDRRGQVDAHQAAAAPLRRAGRRDPARRRRHPDARRAARCASGSSRSARTCSCSPGTLRRQHRRSTTAPSTTNASSPPPAASAPTA